MFALRKYAVNSEQKTTEVIAVTYHENISDVTSFIANAVAIIRREGLPSFLVTKNDKTSLFYLYTEKEVVFKVASFIRFTEDMVYFLCYERDIKSGGTYHQEMLASHIGLPFAIAAIQSQIKLFNESFVTGIKRINQIFDNASGALKLEDQTDLNAGKLEKILKGDVSKLTVKQLFTLAYHNNINFTLNFDVNDGLNTEINFLTNKLE